MPGEWYRQCVDCKDDAFPQLLYFAELAHNAADRIYRSISPQDESGKTLLKPILAPYEWAMTTAHVGFDTTRPVYATRGKCHVSHIVCDTNSWEQKVAQALEEMDERSEEHTSELQSPCNLVCRLLLEKKKTN